MANEPRELKRLLGSLRQQHSAAWLYGVLERHDEPVLILDTSWRLRFYNPAAGKLLEPAGKVQPDARLRALGKGGDYDVWLQGSPGTYEFQFSDTEWEGGPAMLVKLRLLAANGEQQVRPDSAPLSLASSWQTWLDQDRKLRFISPNVLQITGYSPQEFEQAPDLLIALLHPEDRKIYRSHIKEDFEKAEVLSLELRLTDRNGVMRHLRHVCQPSFDEEGNFTGRYGSFQDVSEYAQAEIEARRVQAILEAVSFAGQALFASSWRTVLTDLLGRLGEAAEVDRVSLLANLEREGSMIIRRQYGWQAADLAPELSDQPLKTGPLDATGLGEWEPFLSRNQVMQGHVRDMPARQQAILRARNILSTLAVPVFAGPEWWGFLQFDSLRSERVWSASEVDAIQAFASVLGSTFQRERTEEEIRQLVEQERRKTEMANALREVSLALNAVLDFEVVLDRLLPLAAEVIPFDAGSILWLEDRNARIVRLLNRAQSGGKVVRNPALPAVPLARNPLLQRMEETRKPVFAAQTAWSGEWSNLEGSSTTRSWVGAPIVVENRVYGFFSLGHNTAGFYTQDYAATLAVFSNQAARALQNARLFDDVAQTLIHEQRLNEISQIISSSLDLNAVLQTILQLTTQLVNADLGALALISSDRQEMQFNHTYNLPGPLKRTSAPVGKGLSWEVALKNASLLVDDYQQHPAALEEWKELGVRSFLGVPLVAGSDTLGTLSLFRMAPGRPFSDRDRFLAEMVARQAGIAIQNARRYEEAKHLATHDSLTGVYTRHHFFELAHREYERSLRYQRPLALIMLDLDGLKQINDEYGHQAGDQALQVLAQICKSALRQVDLIGRYGGDEFIILLPETELMKAVRAAERVRERANQAVIQNHQGAVRISVSLGVAALESDVESFEALVDRADQAQYAAKENGKNQVRIWEARPQAES
jgi:diguanylate cyclase (GGDEF)-like protein/PAS domain S-box-containing protein